MTHTKHLSYSVLSKLFLQKQSWTKFDRQVEVQKDFKEDRRNQTRTSKSPSSNFNNQLGMEPSWDAIPIV